MVYPAPPAPTRPPAPPLQASYDGATTSHRPVAASYSGDGGSSATAEKAAEVEKSAGTFFEDGTNSSVAAGEGSSAGNDSGVAEKISEVTPAVQESPQGDVESATAKSDVEVRRSAVKYAGENNLDHDDQKNKYLWID
jgi:type IV secretory pathway TrbL component